MLVGTAQRIPLTSRLPISVRLLLSGFPDVVARPLQG